MVKNIMNNISQTGGGEMSDKCPNCKRLYDALIIALQDEQRRLCNRIKHFNEPSEMSDEERLRCYENSLKNIQSRISFIKDQFKEVV